MFMCSIMTLISEDSRLSVSSAVRSSEVLDRAEAIVVGDVPEDFSTDDTFHLALFLEVDSEDLDDLQP